MFDTSCAAAVKNQSQKTSATCTCTWHWLWKKSLNNQNYICNYIKAPLHCFSHDAFKSDVLENYNCQFAENDDDSWFFEPRVKRCVYLSRQ